LLRHSNLPDKSPRRRCGRVACWIFTVRGERRPRKDSRRSRG